MSGIKNFESSMKFHTNGDNGVKRLRDQTVCFAPPKKNVAKELPPRTRMTLFCALSDEERALSDAVRVLV